MLSWAGGWRRGYISPLRGIVSPLLLRGGGHIKICGWGGKASLPKIIFLQWSLKLDQAASTIFTQLAVQGVNSNSGCFPPQLTTEATSSRQRHAGILHRGNRTKVALGPRQ